MAEFGDLLHVYVDEERAQIKRTTWIAAAAVMANSVRQFVIYRYSCAEHECMLFIIQGQDQQRTRNIDR